MTYGVIFLALLLVSSTTLQAEVEGDAARQRAWDVLDKSLQGGIFQSQEALAAIASIRQPDASAVKRCIAALRDKHPQVRQYAALALGELKSKDAIPYLQSALDDTGEVAFAAAKALMDLGDSSGEEVIIAIIAGERRDTPGILQNAVRDARSKLRHPRDLLLMGAATASGSVFPPAAMGLEAVTDTAQLHGSGTPGRASAAAYLAEDSDPHAIPLLEWALGDDNHLVRLEAAMALGARAGRASVPKLEFTLADHHNSVRDMAAASIIRIEDRNGAEVAAGDPPGCTLAEPQK